MDSKDFRGSAYGLWACLSTLVLLADAPIFILFVGIAAILPTCVGIVRQFATLASVENPGVVAADGLGLIVSDLKLGQPTHDVDEKDLARSVTKVAQITRIPFTTVADTKWWIKSKDLTETSWVVLGPRGSGKSLTMRWMAREALKEDADVYWFDWHWNPEGEQHIDVLPGMDSERYVMQSKVRQLATLKYLISLGQQRLNGDHGKSFKPVVVFWDEFQDITSTALREPFTMQEQEYVNDAVRIIQDGFRKAKIQIVISLKSVKKGQSGLDMSTLLQCNWLFTGSKGKNFSALEDKSAIFPDEISDNRSTLVTEAKAIRDESSGTQGAVCLIDGESVVKAHPDCSTLIKMLKADEGFEVEDEDDTQPEGEVMEFFYPHMKAIEDYVAAKQSKSVIFMTLEGHGEKSQNNPKWVKFGEIYDRIQQQLEVKA